MEKKKQGVINSLYTLKAVCAFFVVLLHSPLGEATEYARAISGIAVPIFFMITGYFLFSSEAENIESKAFMTSWKTLLL